MSTRTLDELVAQDRLLAVARELDPDATIRFVSPTQEEVDWQAAREALRPRVAAPEPVAVALPGLGL